MRKRFWKSLRLQDGKIMSDYDKSEWRIGEWRTVPAPTKECVGLNACENVIDAINYVVPEVLAEVEIFGGCIKGDDKVTCERMRLVKVWKWEKEDSVALAIFAARLCLKNFEDVYPNDDRPRKAIEAAENYQKNPSEAVESAAESAARSAESAARSAESAAESAARSAKSAAWSAESAARSAESAAESAARSARSAAWSAAWSAARSAAWSAGSAAWSAGSAARSAARSAESAAWSAARSAESAAESAARSAESAAWSAARKSTKEKLHDFIVKRFKEKEALYYGGD